MRRHGYLALDSPAGQGMGGLPGKSDTGLLGEVAALPGSSCRCLKQEVTCKGKRIASVHLLFDLGSPCIGKSFFVLDREGS